MKTLEIKTLIKEVENIEELSAEDRELVEAAKAATATSLATYSHFHVGAAIRMDNGEIIKGSNQENAAFPSSMCAERTACYYASSRFPGMRMKKIAIAAWTRKDDQKDAPVEDCFQRLPISPCGACRQALLEYEHLYGKIEVILYDAEKTYIFSGVADLLPFNFVSF